MQEKIYEIAVNDAFSTDDGCPLCSLYQVLETAEMESLSGGAVMEPDLRIKTNRDGLCEKHFNLLIQKAGKLTVGLLLQTHLKEIASDLKEKDLKKRIATTKRLEHSCHACGRIEENMKTVCDTIIYMIKHRPEFYDKLRWQKYICPHHYGILLERAVKGLSKKDLKVFVEEMDKLLENGLSAAKGDVDYFCQKHDYRFRNEPWNGCENAVERAIALLKRTKED